MLIKRREARSSSIEWTPIDAIDFNGMKGSIQVGVSRKWNTPRRYNVAFDDLWDLTEAMEAITLEHGGRVYKAQAPVINAEKLKLERIIAGPISIAETDLPPDWTPGQGFYMRVDLADGQGTQYHNFFLHLEDLVALLHQAVRDAQGLNAKRAAAAVARTLH
jgi:hypothetical protein